jgi:hypothetical protein
MAKSRRQISHIMLHPIHKDERLLSIASDIEVLNAQVERDHLGRLIIENFLKLRHSIITFSFIYTI